MALNHDLLQGSVPAMRTSRSTGAEPRRNARKSGLANLATAPFHQLPDERHHLGLQLIVGATEREASDLKVPSASRSPMSRSMISTARCTSGNAMSLRSIYIARTGPPSRCRTTK